MGGRYLLGDGHTPFALIYYPGRRKLWTRPNGGVILWRLGVWWST